MINPFPNDKFFYSSKVIEFADNNLKFDENNRKFSKQVENTVGKEEIAHQEQFLLFPQCFQGLVLQTRKNQDLLWKGLTAVEFLYSRGRLYSKGPLTIVRLQTLDCLELKEFADNSFRGKVPFY